MPYTIPQFIEHDAKIFGPLTFRQSLYVGSAMALGFIFYFTFGKNNFLLFLFIAVFLAFISVSLAFVTINGKPLTAAFSNVLFFFSRQKTYIWRKKETSPKIITRTLEKQKVFKEEKSVSLKFAERSRLKNLSNQIETRI